VSGALCLHHVTVWGRGGHLPRHHLCFLWRHFRSYTQTLTTTHVFIAYFAETRECLYCE